MTATTTTPAATAERRADLLKWGLDLGQSDAARAANVALRAGLEALDESRAAWAEVKEIANMGPIGGPDMDGKSALLRRMANRLVAEAGRTLGLVSSSAGGLWAVTMEGRIAQVEATSGGSDYLDGVRFVGGAHLDPVTGAYVPTMYRGVEEFPVSQVVAFADSYGAAHEIRVGFMRA